MKSKLIIFAYDFPPSTGGIARLSHAIAIGQLPNFDDVTVLTRSKFEPKDDSLKMVYLPQQRVKCEWAAFRYLRSLKNKEQYAVVCGLWHPEATICRWAGIPNIYILAHGAEFLPRGSAIKKWFWLPFYGKGILHKATKVIANSRFTKKLVLQVAPKSSVIEIPLGVDIDQFSPGDKSLKKKGISVGTVSRLQKHKGHLLVLEAIAKMPKEVRKQLTWHIAGTGPYESRIKQKVSELGLEEFVVFHGFVPEGQLAAFYQSNDLFVLFSQEEAGAGTIEGFGLVFLEAQSAGIPVIGTITGGIPDAVKPNEGGWLLPPDDVSGLAELLVHLTTHPNELIEQGKRARDRVLKEGSWDHYHAHFHEAIQEAK